MTDFPSSNAKGSSWLRPRPRHAAAPGWRQLLGRVVASPVNYWIGFAINAVVQVGLVILGLRDDTQPLLAKVAAVGAGFATWSFLEYVYHRWVLHGAPSFARTSHAHHHGDAHELISTPWFVGPLLAFGLQWLLDVALPSPIATLTVCGLYAGYNYFSVLHHLQHRSADRLGKIGYLRRLTAVHAVHHRRPTTNFGVTTTIWDRAFGTYSPGSDTTSKRSV